MQRQDEFGASPLPVEADRADWAVQQSVQALRVEELEHGRSTVGDKLVQLLAQRQLIGRILGGGIWTFAPLQDRGRQHIFDGGAEQTLFPAIEGLERPGR